MTQRTHTARVRARWINACCSLSAAVAAATCDAPPSDFARDARVGIDARASDALPVDDRAPAPRDVVPIPVDAVPIDDAGPSTPPRAAPDIMVAPPFDTVYRAYDLGAVPGLPHTRYGGCLVDSRDRNTLLIGVDSEASNGSLWAVTLVRGTGGHIIGFAGTARRVASTPYIDANLFYGAGGVVLYTQWPVNRFGQIRATDMAPLSETDLMPIGVGDSPGGAAFVPPGLAAAGGLRMLSWPSHRWWHVEYVLEGDRYRLTSARTTATLPVGSGGFAYVPSGSPMIARPSVVVAEWSTNVSFFEVDAQGDPLPASRRPFLVNLPLAWGAYFEPVTGDFVFPTWGADRVIIVQGFVPPPPPPG